MNFYVIVVVIFTLCLVKIHCNIIFKAKFMGNLRVEGDSHSVYALTVPHCLAMCNKNKSCDSITFNDETKKCRLFKRCTPLQILENNSHQWFYAKRPPVSDNSYFYEENSDTCLKLTKEKLPYKLADKFCSRDNGYLAVLNTVELRQMAKEILRSSEETDAWINPPLKSYEKHAKHKATKEKRWIATREKESEISVCWSLRNHTIEKQSSCENEKRLSICQLPTY